MTLYLIAHKVRGALAFDVAEQVGDMWIIPTSGHRAYPYWTYRLDLDDAIWEIPPLPSDLRDHYEVSAPPPRPGYTDRATSPRTITPKLEDI